MSTSYDDRKTLILDQFTRLCNGMKIRPSQRPLFIELINVLLDRWNRIDHSASASIPAPRGSGRSVHVP